MAFDFGNANEAQRSAISTTDGPLLIIAGPGTGKTYTLVKRIVYLITEKDVLPEEIMIATFTEKAAKELITRITNELYAVGVSVNLNEMYIGTFHSICLRILKDHLEYTRIKKNYRMLDNFDQQYMVFQKINRFRNLLYFDVIFDKKQGAWRQAGEIVKYVNNLAEELVDIDEMQGDADEHIVAVANIMKQYNTLMKDENLIDFSSIQTEAYKLLIEEPSILEEIQQKIKYVMVDEYQDTNYIQELLVFLIAGKNKNICVVGDDDQGLYRFRGATIRNILEFPGHFAEGECKQVKLVTNYRCITDAPIDKTKGAQYLGACITASLHKLNKSGQLADGNPHNSDNKEKWDTCNHFSKIFSGFSSGMWEVWLDLFTKWDVDENIEIPYYLVITVEDLTQTNNIYEAIIQESAGRFKPIETVRVPIRQ